MRNALAVLCLILSGLLSAAALAGHQIDQLLREEEPVREIAGGLPQDEEFSGAVSQIMVSELSGRLPEGVSSFIGGGAEDFVSGIVDGLLDDERTQQAWDETLQNTRADYVERLDRLFAEGTTGDPSELDVRVDLEPMAGAVVASLADSIPLMDADSFEVPTPEMVVDIEAATEGDADPYTWATLAAASQYWAGLAVAAGVLLLLGLLLGHGRGRWAALSVGGITAALAGTWIALTVASPDFGQPEQLPQESSAILQHVESQFNAWAQPVWWFFVAAAGAVVVLGLLGALVARPVQRR